ncbi:MAG: hypothetical protein Q8O67_28120 [Deltaproteobacteria bacterium]|nr:hypothetical protein [Deltaproteobacteria bacterium]
MLALVVAFAMSSQSPPVVEAVPPVDYVTPSVASGAGAVIGGVIGSGIAISTMTLAISQKAEDPTPQLRLLNTVNTFAALAGPPLCAVIGGSVGGAVSDGLPAALGAGFGATVGAGFGAVVGLALIPVGDNAELGSALGQVALRGGVISALGGIGAALGSFGAIAALPVE